MAEPGSVSIGTFARATRLTVKALRHYHDVGVLEPAWIDPTTRYRYYRWEQLADAICVSTLRDLGVPLERVRQHLRGGTSLLEVLSGERARLERQVASAERALAVVNALSDHQQTPPEEPVIVTWDERPTMTVTAVVRSEALNTEVTQLITDLLAAASRSCIDATPPVVGEYQLALEASTNIALHLPCVGAPSTKLAAPGRLPGGPMVRSIHVGPHAALPSPTPNCCAGQRSPATRHRGGCSRRTSTTPQTSTRAGSAPSCRYPSAPDATSAPARAARAGSRRRRRPGPLREYGCRRAANTPLHVAVMISGFHTIVYSEDPTQHVASSETFSSGHRSMQAVAG